MLAFVIEEFKTANVRNAEIDASGIGCRATLRVRRGFGLEGTITVRGETETGVNIVPKVTVSFSGSNRDVVRATAFMHLVSELTLLAASLQAVLDEFNVVPS